MSSIPIPARPTRPLLNAARALEALGELAGAADRHALRDVLVAWRRYLEACGREDLLRVAPFFPPIAIPIAAAKEWQYLVDLALATARNLRALDAERHWQQAGRTFQQAAANAAACNGLRVVETLQAWQAAGWTDEDDEPLTDIGDDVLVSVATGAAHYGRIALGQALGAAASPALCAEAHARCAVDLVVEGVLRTVSLVRRRHPDEDPEVLVCDICLGEDGAHDPDCLLAPLASTNLLRVYRAALEEGQ